MGGGGGGNTTTTTSGVPDFAKPHLKEVLGDVTDRYRQETTGQVDTVAGLTPQQQQALQMQEAAAKDAYAGTGAYDNSAQVQAMLGNLQGQQLAGQANTGTLGSARADRAQQAALADQALNFSNQRKQDIAAGVQALSAAGDKRQQQDQLRLDSPHTSAQRYFGYLGSTGQENTSKQGGGK